MDMYPEKFFIPKIKYLHNSGRYHDLINNYNESILEVGGYSSPESYIKTLTLSQLPLKWDAMVKLDKKDEMIKDMKAFILSNPEDIYLFNEMADIMQEHEIIYLLDALVDASEYKNRGILAQKISVSHYRSVHSEKLHLARAFEKIKPIPGYEKDILIKIAHSGDFIRLWEEHLVEAVLNRLSHTDIQFYARWRTDKYNVSLRLPVPVNKDGCSSGDLRVCDNMNNLKIYPIDGAEVGEYFYASPYGASYMTEDIQLLVNNIYAFPVASKKQQDTAISLVHI